MKQGIGAQIKNQIGAQIKNQIDDLMKKDGLSREEAVRVIKRVPGGGYYHIWSYPCQFCDKKIGSDTEDGFKKKWEDHQKECKVAIAYKEIHEKFTPKEIEGLREVYALGDAEEELTALVKKWKKKGIVVMTPLTHSVTFT